MGIDLRTERPTAKQITDGVARIRQSPRLKQNVARVRADLASHDPLKIIAKCLAEDGISTEVPDTSRQW